jgi:methyl-accepting chemotaxis protein
MPESASNDALEALRAQGARLLVFAGWGWVAALLAIAAAQDGDARWLAPLMAAAITLPATAVRRRSHGAALRLALALNYAAYPAITVFALDGNAWQMDAHLYFLAALAALSLLYDVRALAAASALVAVHHLLAWAVMPDMAFSGSTDLDRVLLHAGAVVVAFAFLTMMVLRARRMIEELAAARIASEATAAAAEKHRVETQRALQAASDAEHRARAERQRREDIEADARARERERLIAFAETFESGITKLAQSLGGSAADLSLSADSLSGLAQETDIRADSVAEVAARASGSARAVADYVTALSSAVSDVGDRTARQADHARQARTASAAGRQSVLSLIERAAQVEQFARAIGDLSTHTNLIALNASVEAARVGAAGKGFSVVAGEVKLLAQQASSESQKIEQLVNLIRQGAAEAEDALCEAGAVLDGASGMADEVRDTMRSQQADAEAARSRSIDLAMTADALVDDTDALTGWAEATRRLSAEVKTAATSLNDDATALLESTRAFVAQLQAA